MQNVPPILKSILTGLVMALLVIYLQTYGPIQTRKMAPSGHGGQNQQGGDIQNTFIERAPPLHEAVLNTPDIRAAVEQLAQTPPRQFTQYTHAIQNLLFVWTGTADIPMDSRGQWIDARKLATIERVRGKVMRFAPDDRVNPMKYQSRLVMQGWWMGVFYPVSCPLFTYTGLNGMSMEDLAATVEHRYSDQHQMPPQVRQNLNTVVNALRPDPGANDAEYRGYLSYVLHCMAEARRPPVVHLTGDRQTQAPPEEYMAGINIILHDAGVPHSAEKLFRVQFVVDEIDHKFDTETLGQRLLYFFSLPYARVFVPFLLFVFLAAAIAKTLARAKQTKRL